MAHFAELDANNIVQRVIVISNDDLLDSDGVEQEALGIAVCRKIFGENTRWVQTSYNHNFRRTYAGNGFKYDETADVFYVADAPFPSWTLDANFDWQPPTPMPTDDNYYVWDEDSLSWVVEPEPTVGE